MRTIPALAFFGGILLTSCTRTSDDPGMGPAPGKAAEAPKPAAPSAPATTLNLQPSRVKFANVLIAFQGVGRPGVTRSKEEAEKLAKEIFERAKKGEDFETLMKQSDDTPPGTYGVFQTPETEKPGDAPRSMIDPGVAQMAFSLKVGEVGLCAYEPQASPFGWRVIKRLE